MLRLAGDQSRGGLVGHTKVSLAKEPAGLGGGGRRRRVLDLRRRRGARLAHGVGAVHDGVGCGVGSVVVVV